MSDKEKYRAVNQTCNTCGNKGHFSSVKFYKQTKRSRGEFEAIHAKKEKTAQ